MQFRIVIPAPEVVQLGLLVPHIPPIAEGIEPAQRFICSCQVAPGDGFAPCVVLVFYHKCACAVNNSHDITLQIVDIGVGISAKLRYFKEKNKPRRAWRRGKSYLRFRYACNRYDSSTISETIKAPMHAKSTISLLDAMYNTRLTIAKQSNDSAICLYVIFFDFTTILPSLLLHKPKTQYQSQL